MFIGHFAVGFASKKIAPKVSLGWLILAPLFLDVIWPCFLALGIETVRIEPGNTAFTPLDLHDYPYSHSLAMSLMWSVPVGGLYFANKRALRDALILGALVFSHFILDFVTHRPDMPLYPGSEVRIGLGLWNLIPATLIVEGLMFLVGVAIYTRTTRARDRVGTWGWWCFVGFLGLTYLSAAFGPPPPSVPAIIAMAFSLWLFFPWAIWIDRHRAV